VVVATPVPAVRTYLPVAAGGLFTSIVQIVLVPVLLRLVLRLVVPRLVERLLPALPLVSRARS
jgi:BASS family bile acid:Na+ symporter